MLGFEGNDLKGIKAILRRLSNNSSEEIKNRVLTHKEVRAYGRGILLIIPLLNLPSNTESELKTLLACMSVEGLPLYDRAFFAKEALEVIEKYENSLRFSVPQVARDWDVASF